MTFRILPFIAVCLALLTFQISSPAVAQDGPLSGSRQIVLVLADSWDSRNAEMLLFERQPGTPWRQAGGKIRVLLGRNGLGWGLGLHGEPGEGPVKREGDGKAPAGIFRFGSAFGYAPEGARKLKMPYLRITGSVECVDDTASPLYNRFADSSKLPSKDWKSSETMLRPDNAYSLGVYVEHNSAPPKPGAGSCIFIHIWRNPGGFTSGCTSMAPENMERLAKWLDESKSPLLVQLPRSERAAFTKRFGTP